jgi:Protein of unknown function (DUF2591)
MDAAELRGAELDAWVALAQGHLAIRVLDIGGRRECRSLPPHASQPQRFDPSSDWALAGPIIRHERISLRDMVAHRPQPMFEAMLRSGEVTWFAEGELPLIAAMRVYVRSRYSEAQLAEPPFQRPALRPSRRRP